MYLLLLFCYSLTLKKTRAFWSVKAHQIFFFLNINACSLSRMYSISNFLLISDQKKSYSKLFLITEIVCGCLESVLKMIISFSKDVWDQLIKWVKFLLITIYIWMNIFPDFKNLEFLGTPQFSSTRLDLCAFR